MRAFLKKLDQIGAIPKVHVVNNGAQFNFVAVFQFTTKYWYDLVKGLLPLKEAHNFLKRYKGRHIQWTTIAEADITERSEDALTPSRFVQHFKDENRFYLSLSSFNGAAHTHLWARTMKKISFSPFFE